MPRIMKLHRYIDHDSQMTPNDFQVTRSMKFCMWIEPYGKYKRYFRSSSHKMVVAIAIARLCGNRIKKAFANSLDPDETPQNVAYPLIHLGGEDQMWDKFLAQGNSSGQGGIRTRDLSIPKPASYH
ncbi:hypothetical protein DPMN_007120 [Dreissena polymorpha]|uniref:Uncharacterized protein n=1 Tax=Dreissena polymorpha TaxID=45954 RepID=A0A9D4RY34_DREPO|nr:hypothetical protein DPMN_007120 [Dreissena polymorpha]